MGWGQNIPLRVTIAIQPAIETVNINDGLGGDTLQNYFSHSQQDLKQHFYNI